MSAGIRFVVGAMLAVLLSALFSVDVHAQTRRRESSLLAADSTASVADVTAKLAVAGPRRNRHRRGRRHDDADPDARRVAGLSSRSSPGPIRLAAMRIPTRARQRAGRIRGCGWWCRAGGAFAFAGQYLSVSMAAGALEATSPLLSRRRSTSRRASSLTWPVQPTHPITEWRTCLQWRRRPAFYNQMQPQGCAETIAIWSNGRVLVAARVGPRGGRIVGLNMYPVSTASARNWDTGLARRSMMANALRFVTTPARGATGRRARRGPAGSDRRDAARRRAMQASGHVSLLAGRCVRRVRRRPQSCHAQSIRRGV